MAQFIPSIERFADRHREHCSANRSQIRTIGLRRRQQARLEIPAENDTKVALYTIVQTHGEKRDKVFVSYRNADELKARLGITTNGPFPGRFNAQVTVDLSEEDASKVGEFIERLDDNGQHRGLIAIAPHGGQIEPRTDEQAEQVCKRLSSKGVSVWLCKGFRKEEEDENSAYGRWHITSSDISEKSFPLLEKVYRRHFEYAVAFHGWNDESNSICIGGRAPNELKQQVEVAIKKIVSGSDITVAIGCDCPSDFNGDDDDNIVNRLGINGLQLEQSKQARKHFGKDIANAVADIIGPRITV
jgi:phage replication-related protein YjqB (UPF0714/DUF867 family)